MKDYFVLFEVFFVFSSEKLNVDFFIGVFQFFKDMDDNESIVVGFIYMFIKNVEVDILEKFFFFVIGVKVFFEFGFVRIQVKFDGVLFIFVLICLLEIIFLN